MAAKLSRLDTLPAFLFAVFTFYWSVPLLAITNVFYLDMKGLRQDMLHWARLMRAFFRVKILKIGTQNLYKPKRPILYLCNHRSWADFFIDVVLTEGSACMMSRMLVFWVFPVFMTVCSVIKGVILFKRGTIADKQAFNAWLDTTLASSPLPGLVVYPEGHRSTKPQSLPLKRGMVHYAHSRKMPVQIIIARGKESVLSEKAKTVTWGSTCAVSYSAPIESKDLDFEAFWTQIKTTWDKQWTEVYSADLAGLPPLLQDATPTYDYTKDMRLKQFFAMTVPVPVFWITMWACVKIFFYTTAFLGIIGQQVLLAAFAILLIRSVYACQVPV